MKELIITHIQNDDFTWDSFIPNTNIKVRKAKSIKHAKIISRILLDEEFKNTYFIRAESMYFYKDNEHCLGCGNNHD